MKSHWLRWVLAGFGIGVAIGIAVKVVREMLIAQAEDETSPDESQPESRELQPVA